MDNARRYGGWGVLFFFGLMLIVVGMLGRMGALLGAVLVPDSLIVDSDVDTSGTAGSFFTNLANAAAEGR